MATQLPHHCPPPPPPSSHLYLHNIFPSQDLSDIGPNTNSRQYKGRAVTRREMMEILSSFESLMIRARFHTVQIEGMWVPVCDPLRNPLENSYNDILFESFVFIIVF